MLGQQDGGTRAGVEPIQGRVSREDDRVNPQPRRVLPDPLPDRRGDVVPRELRTNLFGGQLRDEICLTDEDKVAEGRGI